MDSVRLVGSGCKQMSTPVLSLQGAASAVHVTKRKGSPAAQAMH